MVVIDFAFLVCGQVGRSVTAARRRTIIFEISSRETSLILETTVIGSYPQPDWLIDRDRLRSRLPPRVAARELWRVAEPLLEQAQDDATALVIHEQEQIGVDVITDGEIRRESYSNRFATALDGIDLDNPGTALDRTGHPNPVPRVVGPIRRAWPVQKRDVEFLRQRTDRRIRVTVPGPFTMTQRAQDDYYGDPAAMSLAYAEAVNAELRDAVAAGADIVQIDEPYLQARPDAAREFAIPALNRALDGIASETALHTCFGYAAIVKNRASGYSFLAELNACAADQICLETAQPQFDLSILTQLPSKKIVVGVLDLGDPEAESSEVVASRIREALRYLPPARLSVGSDCGMKYLPRGLARAKLQALVEGAQMVRSELSRES